MDFLNLGADLGIVGGIITITELIKQFDQDKKFKKYYVLIPAILSIPAAFIVSKTFDWHEIAKNFLLYLGVSTYIYKAGKTFIGGK